MGPATVLDIVRSSANRHPERVAILAADRPDCSYQELVRHVEDTRSALAEYGVRPGDCVAIVLPNGPEMTVALLSVSAAATCAPLNPAYREHELEFYLRDLEAAAVIVADVDAGPADAVAARLGIPVIRCRTHENRPAGCFELVPSDRMRPRAAGHAATRTDIALLLHTSGTTARPKLVPLSHGNLCASARNIARTLLLEPADRCLNLLPLFHIHGIVAALLSTLASGGSVVATPGFPATSVLEWLDQFEPTWFTAVPSMHQALLARSRRLGVKPASKRLRFIRSSSAPLPTALIADLERLFGVPVIEAYGMTEAAHQMASNPLPPAVRKPGSVGPAAGPEVAIIDEHGRLAEVGVEGEVVVRGENVISGYAGDPQANVAAFSDGWLRTGDRGWLDSDGYLFLTGRLKERINRGGEKVAPREIDEVFSAHPAVAQALAFAVPDERLGEEIGLAIVLREGHQVTARDLLAFAAEQLADFKLPRHIRFLDELPKGPTGKFQRIGLADRLGLGRTPTSDTQAAGRLPSTPRERMITDAFAEVLRLERVHADDGFFRLGGDSLLAVALACRLEELTGVEIPTYLLFEHDTPAALAAYIDSSNSVHKKARPALPGTEDADTPLSSQQEFHWTIETLFRGTPINHRPGAIRMRGPLDVSALRAAIDDVLWRHPALRSRVVLRGRRPRMVEDSMTPRSTPVDDLSEMPSEPQQTTVGEIARRFARDGFDLQRGPLFKTMILRLSANDHVLLTNAHHMIFDGWSMSVLVSDLAALYAAHAGGAGPVLPKLSATYAEHAIDERCAFDDGRLDASLEYWRAQLERLPRAFSPATHHERPTGIGREHRMAIDPGMAAQIAAACQARATPFMTHLAVFGAFCRTLGAPDDLVVGALVSGRTTPRLARLVGCFYNILPIRLSLSEDPTFAELAERTRQTATAALMHQAVPYGRLLRVLRPPGGRFFDIAFQYRNFPPLSALAGGVRFEDMPIDWGLSQWDLGAEVTPRDTGAELRFTYQCEMKEPDRGAQWSAAFGRALEWAADGNRPLSDLAGSKQ